MEFLSREVCEQLKAAGYPQGSAEFTWAVDTLASEPYPSGWVRIFDNVPMGASCPSLCELKSDLLAQGYSTIVVCGPNFCSAQIPIVYLPYGTPNIHRAAREIDAVAALWLAVKEKKVEENESNVSFQVHGSK